MKRVSKKYLLIFILSLFTVSTLAQELKVLTIGNSFSQSLEKYFKDVVKSVEGCSLDLEFANFGGCELDRHWSYITQEEQQGKQIYRGTTTLKKILQSKKWDIITIQQASHKSFIKETYFPYAQNIVDYIKKYCPTAKILIQQTWSYRVDCHRFKKWGFSQDEMFDKLEKAYLEASEKLGIEQIYMGKAVQLARKTIISEPFTPPTNLKDYRYPDLPKQSGDIVGQYSWKKSKGKMVLKTDTIHLNEYGKYLQACVWFTTLYKKSATEIKFIPDIMDDSLAKKIHQIADKVSK